MNDDEIWQVIDAQRAGLADLLAGLTDAQWRHPSLCAGWNVRDVAAHLTLQEMRVRDIFRQLGSMRGSMDRSIFEMARRRAEWPTDRLVAQIRQGVGSRQHNVGVTIRETLTDLLVHGQDIAIPLGLPHEVPVQAAAEAATRNLSTRYFKPRARLGPYRLAATDLDWSYGDGPLVEGRMADLLLLVCRRAIALDRLTGAGAEELRREAGRIQAA